VSWRSGSTNQTINQKYTHTQTELNKDKKKRSQLYKTRYNTVKFSGGKKKEKMGSSVDFS
jgi:hypothetical protein